MTPLLAVAAGSGDTLVALGGAFLAAAVLARLGRRVGLPTIPFFMAAGVLFGPHTPGFVLVARPDDLDVFATVGLVLLLFHLGLEFSLRDLTAGGPRLLRSGVVDLAVNVGGGIALGFAIGWGTGEAFVLGGIVGISSSAVVTKLLVELRRLADPETRVILGMVVAEDVFIAVYLALLQPVLHGSEGAGDAVLDVLRAVFFLLALAFVARWGSGLVGRVIAVPHEELLTVSFLGLAVLVAGLAAEAGVSEAIGAFMAGAMLATSAVARQVERLVLPLRDAFGAVFFFAFGLSVDPGDVGRVLGPVAAAVLFSLCSNVVVGQVAARFHGFGRREGTRIGLTLLARGEFALVLAALAVGAGLDERVTPFAAAYVLVLAVAGPLAASRLR